MRYVTSRDGIAVRTETLRFGDRGEAVTALQRILNARLKSATPLDLDGRFGAETRGAVLRYQTLHRLRVDGVVGPVTWAMLLVPRRLRDSRSTGKAAPSPPSPLPTPATKSPKPTKPVAELVVTVKDLLGKPVEGATVSAGALGSRPTDKDGIADFGTVTPGTYDITAAKAGHGKRRNGPEEKDQKTGVAVHDGSKTEVALIQHPECANVAFFEGSKTRANYFGFDHKTNIKAAPNGEYWVPVPSKGTLVMPTNKLTRDEARWVSVAVGKVTEVEINYLFDGTECIPCLANCTFQIIPDSVAEVVTAKVTAKQAVFQIKGKAKGEASLKVVCDDHDIGWFHIWCEVQKELLVDVATIVTTRAAAVTYDLAGLSDYMNEIYRQHLVTLNLKDLGTIDVSASASLATSEATEFPVAGGMFQQGTTESTDTLFLTALDMAAMASVAKRTTGPTGRAGARRLYWYVPTAGAQWGGMNLSIGHPATFIFYQDGTPARNTGAHEIGHSMKLRHPSDPSGASQFAAHNVATVSTAVPAYKATNTEPASVANPAHANIMANDPTNLMGYWPDKSQRKALRYHQWKAADRS